MPITVPSKPFVPTAYTTTPAEITGVANDGLGNPALLKTGALVDALGVFSQVNGIAYRNPGNPQLGDISIVVQFDQQELQIWKVAGAAIPITVYAPGAGRGVLILMQDAVGGRTVVWPATVRWPGGFPPILSTAANAVDIFHFTLWQNPTSGNFNYFGRARLNYTFT